MFNVVLGILGTGVSYYVAQKGAAESIKYMTGDSFFTPITNGKTGIYTQCLDKRALDCGYPEKKAWKHQTCDTCKTTDKKIAFMEKYFAFMMPLLLPSERKSCQEGIDGSKTKAKRIGSMTDEQLAAHNHEMARIDFRRSFDLFIPLVEDKN